MSAPDGQCDNFGGDNSEGERAEIAEDIGRARALVFLLGCVAGGFLVGAALLWLGWPAAITAAIGTVCLTSVALVPFAPRTWR